MAKAIIFFIRLYQRSLSPDHGLFRAGFLHGFCPFRPTCSQYAIDCLRTHGWVVGIFKGLGRVFRCRPGRGPSFDPVK